MPPLPWHQDGAYFQACCRACWSAPGSPIDRATIANGCLRIIPGSHRQLLARNNQDASEDAFSKDIASRADPRRVSARSRASSSNQASSCCSMNSPPTARRPTATQERRLGLTPRMTRALRAGAAWRAWRASSRCRLLRGQRLPRHEPAARRRPDDRLQAAQGRLEANARMGMAAPAVGDGHGRRELAAKARAARGPAVLLPAPLPGPTRPACRRMARGSARLSPMPRSPRCSPNICLSVRRIPSARPAAMKSESRYWRLRMNTAWPSGRLMAICRCASTMKGWYSMSRNSPPRRSAEAARRCSEAISSRWLATSTQTAMS